jgi:hypothetical protein
MIDQQALELLAGVLAALVGMMQQRVRFAATPHIRRQPAAGADALG